MEYDEIFGDLIVLAKQNKFDVIAHGCNCFCTMGAGIAPKMAKAFDCDEYDLETKFLWEGDINEVYQYGGEGMGSRWESIKYFKDHDIYIKVDGFYTSYNGTNFEDWDNSCREVRPIEKTITVYE